MQSEGGGGKPRQHLRCKQLNSYPHLSRHRGGYGSGRGEHHELKFLPSDPSHAKRSAAVVFRSARQRKKERKKAPFLLVLARVGQQLPGLLHQEQNSERKDKKRLGKTQKSGGPGRPMHRQMAVSERLDTCCSVRQLSTCLPSPVGSNGRTKDKVVTPSACVIVPSEISWKSGREKQMETSKSGDKNRSERGGQQREPSEGETANKIGPGQPSIGLTAKKVATKHGQRTVHSGKALGITCCGYQGINKDKRITNFPILSYT